MTLAADRPSGLKPRRSAADQRPSPAAERSAVNLCPADQPVQFWPTSAIRSALRDDDIATWKRIAVALKRDPYGRTARQVEEVLESTRSCGISEALREVLERARTHLEADERAEVARHMQLLMDRSGLGAQEFGSRIGVPIDDLAAYLEARVSPSASLMIRIRRLSDRFAEVRSRRPTGQS